jgi:dynein heavy chain
LPWPKEALYEVAKKFID